MKRFLHVALSAAAIIMAGCASRPEAAGGRAETLGGRASSRAETVGDAAAYATCHVCEYNNDLACVRFRKKETTPTLTYGGQTYSFCSEDCRAACAKNPRKYLDAKR